MTHPKPGELVFMVAAYTAMLIMVVAVDVAVDALDGQSSLWSDGRYALFVITAMVAIGASVWCFWRRTLVTLVVAGVASGLAAGLSLGTVMPGDGTTMASGIGCVALVAFVSVALDRRALASERAAKAAVARIQGSPRSPAEQVTS